MMKMYSKINDTILLKEGENMSLCYPFILLLGTFVIDKQTSTSWLQ